MCALYAGDESGEDHPHSIELNPVCTTLPDAIGIRPPDSGQSVRASCGFQRGLSIRQVLLVRRALQRTRSIFIQNRS